MQFFKHILSHYFLRNTLNLFSLEKPSCFLRTIAAHHPKISFSIDLQAECAIAFLDFSCLLLVGSCCHFHFAARNIRGILAFNTCCQCGQWIQSTQVSGFSSPRWPRNGGSSKSCRWGQDYNEQLGYNNISSQYSQLGQQGASSASLTPAK